MELDLLGDLLMETLKFLDSGFDGSLVLRDETTISDIAAKEMFAESEGRWFMRQESIPGDLSIKAIGVDADGLYLETGPLDIPKVTEVVVEEMLPFAFDASGLAFKDMHTGKELVTVSKPVQVEKELGFRSLLTVPLKDISNTRRDAIIKLLDLLYGRGCFMVEQEEGMISVPTSQQIVQRLQLGLQQKLMAEQRPLLSLKAAVQDVQRGELRTELQMLLSLERRILSMGPETLLDFLVEYVTKNGEARAKNILLFTIAGKIKHTMPKMSWKEARELARKVTARMPVGETA
jgi:hypothetical protein